MVASQNIHPEPEAEENEENEHSAASQTAGESEDEEIAHSDVTVTVQLCSANNCNGVVKYRHPGQVSGRCNVHKEPGMLLDMEIESEVQLQGAHIIYIYIGYQLGN